MTENHMETWIHSYENIAATGQYMAMVSGNARSSAAASAEAYPSTTIASASEVSALQLQETAIVSQLHLNARNTDSDEQIQRWVQYADPATNRLYWWRDNNNWFFVDTGYPW